MRASSVISTILRIGIDVGRLDELQAGIPPGGLQALGLGDSTARRHDDEEKNDEKQTFHHSKSNRTLPRLENVADSFVVRPRVDATMREAHAVANLIDRFVSVLVAPALESLCEQR